MKNKNTKSKPVIVEARYVGRLLNDPKWYKWKSYNTDSVANSAMTVLRRNWTNWEFRIKGKTYENL